MEGKEIGDFEIKRIIGEGSLGPVYLAEHKFIRKYFAIKFLPHALYQNDEFKKNFTDQISKIARLEHENIAAVHNVSSFNDQLFIVSDFVPFKQGTSMNLATYLSTCPERLKEEQILQILKEVAFALDYIHGQNILSEPLVHGGVKLSNILLTQNSDESLKVKLTDAGIIPMVGSGYVLDYMLKHISDNDDEKLKAAQRKRDFLQTFAFLAPEQRFSEEKKVSFKSDVYSFGVLTYFLLMGYLPEGHFVMPDAMYKNSNIDWNMIIRATLAQLPGERVDNLTTLIKNASAMVKLEEIHVPEIPKKSAYSYAAPEKLDVQDAPSYSNPTPSIEEMAYAKVATQSPPKEIPEQQQISQQQPTKEQKSSTFEPQASITQLEQNLMGSISRPLNVSPMKMSSSSVKTESEPVDDPTLIFKKEKMVRSYKPEKVDTDGIKPLLTETITIKAGTYERGSMTGARDEKPRHKVNIKEFSIDVHPVTNEQFLRFLLVMEGEKDDLNHDTILLKESRIKRQGGGLTIETGYAKHPVVGVSYYGAKAYAKWVGRRLPTEAEWEISASMGNAKNIFPFGGMIERGQANFFSSDTTPVMSYPPSKNGLYDMAGNVYEWCEDWYDYNFYETSEQEPDNPEGPKQGVYRVLRGGCWKSLVDDMRCSHRFRNNPNIMNKTYGFRCVSVIDES
ncbi:MAG: Serine/threonine-protein kinase Pkn1 [Chlamydiia bacterium]|nr:Serine/threonine-protein kinase Pkn1 [Chlamydiia bacterium]